MPEPDEQNYEQRLRDALRQVTTPSADADSVLARVEQGVRQRVRRRRIGAATLGAAAVLTAAAVVIPNIDDDSTVADGPGRNDDRGSSSHPHTGKHRAQAPSEVKPPRRGIGSPKSTERPPAGKVTKASNVTVSGLAVNESGDVGVIGRGTCKDGPCLVAGSPANDVDFRVAPTDGNRLKTMKLTETKTVGSEQPGIELGSDSSNRWAWTDAFFATHDAGKTWNAVALPDSLRVNNVRSNNGRVWAFGVRANGRAGVASATEHGDKWEKVAVPVGAHESIKSPMVVDGSVAFVASDQFSRRSALVRRTSFGWTRDSAPCPAPVESSSSDSTVWLGCKTPSNDRVVAWSHDGGRNWDMTLIRRHDLTAVGGVSSKTAIAGVGADMMMIGSTNGTRQKVSAPFTTSDDVWGGKVGYTSIRFDSSGTGYATTTGGALARSNDGGRTWHPQSLP